MANERIIKNYPSQATGILLAQGRKSRKWLAISSQNPINSIFKSQFSGSQIRDKKSRKTSIIKFLDKELMDSNYSANNI